MPSFEVTSELRRHPGSRPTRSRKPVTIEPFNACHIVGYGAATVCRYGRLEQFRVGELMTDVQDYRYGEELVPESAGREVPVNPYSLLEAVNDASEVAHTCWLIFLGVIAYLTVAVAGVSHKDLLLNVPLMLPVLRRDRAHPLLPVRAVRAAVHALRPVGPARHAGAQGARIRHGAAAAGSDRQAHPPAAAGAALLFLHPGDGRPRAQPAVLRLPARDDLGHRGHPAGADDPLYPGGVPALPRHRHHLVAPHCAGLRRAAAAWHSACSSSAPRRTTGPRSGAARATARSSSRFQARFSSRCCCSRSSSRPFPTRRSTASRARCRG